MGKREERPDDEQLSSEETKAIQEAAAASVKKEEAGCARLGELLIDGVTDGGADGGVVDVTDGSPLGGGKERPGKSSGDGES